MDSVVAASLLIVTNYIQSFKAVVSLGQINEINSKLFPLWVLSRQKWASLSFCLSSQRGVFWLDILRIGFFFHQ